MPSENVEIVVQSLRDFESEDFEKLEERWHEDIVISGPEGWPEPGPFTGRAAVRGQFERLTSDFDSHRFRDVEVVREAGEWVVIGFLWDVSGAGSGAPVTSKMAAAFRTRARRFSEAHFRWTEQEALEAAGLESAGA